MSNIGIIGTGWVAGIHGDALVKIPGVRIAAIAGRNSGQAAKLAQKYGSAVYGNYLDMLQKEKLDAVFICLPPHLHGEVEYACAQYVPAVLLEKPICNDLETALKIEETFKKAGTIVSVGYMNRYRPSLVRAREVFSSSAQKPVMVNGWWVSPMPGPKWWRTMSESGGQFVEQCTHIVDAARWIAGEITEVSAYNARGFVTGVSDYDVDDGMVVNVRFASGAIGNFTTGCFPSPESNIEDIGLLVCSGDIRCQFSGWGFKLKLDHRKGHCETIDPENDDVFLTQNRLFLQAAAEKNPSLIRSSYSDAVKTLKVTLAANESCLTKKAVTIL